jgi:hypothetical protein
MAGVVTDECSEVPILERESGMELLPIKGGTDGRFRLRAAGVVLGALALVSAVCGFAPGVRTRSKPEDLAIGLSSLPSNDFPEECISSEKQSQWFGTAPWCHGHDGDCQAWGGEKVQECSDCSGSTCWKGTKVRCEKEIKRGILDECNPICSSFYHKTWVGTAPACGGSECDCIATDSIPMVLEGGSGHCECNQQGNCPNFGSTCFTGQKVLCIKPKTMSAAVHHGITEMKKQCNERHIIEEQTKQMVLSGLLDLTKAAIESGALTAAASR